MIGALIAAGRRCQPGGTRTAGRLLSWQLAPRTRSRRRRCFWYLIAAGRRSQQGRQPWQYACDGGHSQQDPRNCPSAELDALMMAAIHSPARAEAALAGARLTRSRFASLGCATTVLARGGGESERARLRRLTAWCRSARHCPQAETALGRASSDDSRCDDARYRRDWRA
jgi:hypothetical protein